ncbi:MAG: hypothetical protein ACFCU3_05110 [Verrucomicrobiales bacterium]
MSTVTAILEPDVDGTLHLPVPEEFLAGKVRVVATLEPLSNSGLSAAMGEASSSDPVSGLLGFWKGNFVFTEGWEEPLEEFRETFE